MRWLSFRLSSCLLAIALSAFVTNSARTDEPKQEKKSDSQTRVEADIPYVVGAGEKQKLDLYTPERKGFSTIVFTYGGGWRAGSRKNVAVIGKKLASFGFGCAVLDHRSGTTDKFPAQIEDVAAAFAWVKQHIAEKGGDPSRIFVMGHSSGAHLSLLLATDPKYLAQHKLAASDIAGVIGLSTILDLEPRKDGKSFGDVALQNPVGDVFSRDSKLMRNASPIQHISKDLPRTLLVVGDKDFPVLEGDAELFAEKAKTFHRSASFFIAKDCTHMGVVQALLIEKSPVVEQVLGFLRESPGGKR